MNKTIKTAVFAAAAVFLTAQGAPACAKSPEGAASKSAPTALTGREGRITESGYFLYTQMQGAADKKALKKQQKQIEEGAAINKKLVNKVRAKAQQQEAAAIEYWRLGREGKMMSLGDVFKKREEGKKPQAPQQKADKPEAAAEPAQQTQKPLDIWYHGREGKMMMLSEIWPAKSEDKKQNEPAEETK
ncbi:MAG: hypothetical protein LBR90_00550 [Elusimicrobiota bacterium]|jgi:hypothetical protein|nr:hypothetical protein [Elusimicrobiota bacterium]